jgi:hypothetical protein
MDGARAGRSADIGERAIAAGAFDRQAGSTGASRNLSCWLIVHCESARRKGCHEIVIAWQPCLVLHEIQYVNLTLVIDAPRLGYIAAQYHRHDSQ